MKTSCKQIISLGTSWFLVLLTIVLLLTGCTTEYIPEDSTEYVFDDLGRLVAFDETPHRIISLSPSNTEILFTLGLGEKVVGVTDWCDYPPQAVDKEKVGAYDTPDVEKIVALTPDLILVAHGTTMDVINNLVGLGLTVFGIKTTDLDDLVNDIRTIGEITDTEAEAEALTSEMVMGFQTVTSQTQGLEQRPRVFYMVWHDPLWAAGSGSFIHELIEKGGGVNICQDIEGYVTISVEEVVARNPEVIITSEWSYDWALNSTELASTSAGQTGRIYTCDDDLVQRPGPRLADGLEWFAHFIQPGVFEEPEA
jgi:iron complex transport system substrate-binding protein